MAKRRALKRFIAGYTLIEILIVLFIISIVTSVALLSISRNENRQLESFANELTQIVTLAEEQAILQPAVLGLVLNPDSFHFMVYEQQMDEKKTPWSPLEDSLLGHHMIPAEIELTVAVGGKSVTTAAEDKHPQITISTNGDITPFTIYVAKRGAKPRYLIRGDANGNVSNQLLS